MENVRLLGKPPQNKMSVRSEPLSFNAIVGIFSGPTESAFQLMGIQIYLFSRDCVGGQRKARSIRKVNNRVIRVNNN